MLQNPEAVEELKAIRRVLVYVAILLSGVVFYFAKDIMMPVMLGILITLTLAPVVRALQSIKIPAPIGAVIVIVSISTIVSVGISTLSSPVGAIFNSLPEIGERLSEHLRPLRDTMDDISEAGDQVSRAGRRHRGRRP